MERALQLGFSWDNSDAVTWCGLLTSSYVVQLGGWIYSLHVCISVIF
jgi:hypothetical protein